MKNKQVLRLAATALTGAMLFGMSMTASASTAYHPQSDAGVPDVAGVEIKQRGDSDYLVVQNVLNDEQRVYVEWSTDASFPDNNKTDYASFYNDENDGYSLYDLEPGKSYYIRAFIKDYSGDSVKYGKYSSSITYTAKLEKPYVQNSDVGSTSISVNFGANSADTTGYEIYRATGNKAYKRIAKISDNVFKDTGLEKETTYRYKVRAFYYDKKTGTTTNSDWIYFRKTTWGSDLDLRVTAASSKSAKLTWKKVTGASGYEIYRIEGYATSDVTKDGKNASYTNYKLIKTINKAKTSSYTDKKLTPGDTYSYKVIAFKEDKSKKKAVRTFTVQDTDSVTLEFSTSMNIVTEADLSDGSVKLVWKKVLGAQGYVIEKRNNQTGAFEKYGTLAATTTTYVFPKSTDSKGNDDKYYIYAYNGNQETEKYSVYTSNNVVAQPAGVYAAATEDGQGINISWNAVPGATYYRVIRSKRYRGYNADNASYSYSSGDYVYIAKGQLSQMDETSRIETTSVSDVHLEYTPQGATEPYVLNEGPDQGIKYYYYVIAYKESKDTDGDTSYESSLAGKPAGIALNPSVNKASVSSVKSKKKAQVTVSWKKVEGASKYYVYTSAKKGSGYTLAGTTSKTSLTVKKLKSGKKVYVKIRAYRTNAVGADVFSAYSSVKSVKVK